MKREARRALEEIVGPENITEDPAVLDSYIYQWLGEFCGEPSDRFTQFRPEAVVCPGSTEEVQAIVRACNRFGLRFKAHSTGLGVHSVPGTEGVVLLDLRRMNRILELNEADAYAVVEPYVNWAQLQAEAMRRGLNCPSILSVGCTSVLASVTSYMGVSCYNSSMGYNNKNVLAAEWVLPTGEILRLGSLGSEAGWVSGDGPGPSLRGIMRGRYGAMGGLGVFTKCAVRLYHWPGPPELKVKNITLREQTIEKYPENMDVFSPGFDSLEQRFDAYRKLGEAEIGYSSLYLGLGAMVSTTVMRLARRDLQAAMDLQKELSKILPRASLTVLLAGNSRREFEYQKRVIERIAAESGGRIEEMIPGAKDGMTLLLTRIGNAPAGLFGLGSFMALNAILGSWRSVADAERIGIETKRKYIEKGLAYDDLGESTVGFTFEHGHAQYIENDMLFYAWDPASVENHLKIVEQGIEAIEAKKFIIPYLPEMRLAYRKGGNPHERMGPKLSDYQRWMKRVKRAFDPNVSCDPSRYISP